MFYFEFSVSNVTIIAVDVVIPLLLGSEFISTLRTGINRQKGVGNLHPALGSSSVVLSINSDDFLVHT